MRTQQRIIEHGHRRQVGERLRQASARRRATVYLEPLGDMGFFSGLKMFDYPRFCSREVIAARRKGAAIIKTLQPDWLVCRPEEAHGVATTFGDYFTQHYRLAHVFNARPAVEACEFLPGRGYLEYDVVFLVLEKQNQTR
jgi:hypothetical protein